MFDLNSITRKNIRQLKAYSSARDEYTGAANVFLDANENPFGELNRYPDPYQWLLKEEISKITGASAQNIFVGNGSDEIIDLLFRIFCNPGKDKALTFTPTYGMYDVSAGINDVELIKVPLNTQFDIAFESITPYLKDPQLKLIFICAPNNPTGNSPNRKVVERIIQSFNGIVCIDEAYIDFSSENSFAQLINSFPNLVVSRTMSKARGLAAARIGWAFANSKCIELLNRVKPPYNISKLNQEAALEALQNQDAYYKELKQILKNKKQLKTSLEGLPFTVKVFPSETNFFLVEFTNAQVVYEFLNQRKIIVRDRSKIVSNCLRIAVGSEQENTLLIEALKSL